MSTESNERSTEGEPTVVEEGGFEPQAPVEWATLSEFRVQIHKQSMVSADVFANGRQQAPIEVVIQARDKNNVAVSLTEEQLKGVHGVKLIEYEAGNSVPHCSHVKDNRFVYEWPLAQEDGIDVKEGASKTPEATAQTVSIYVRKTELTTTWIAAEFRNPATGAIFRTNTPNPPTGKFDSWVKLRGKQPEAQDWGCFAMARTDYMSGTGWDIDLYYVYFTITKLRIVASIKYGSAGDDDAHYSWIKDGRQTRHVAYPAGARRDVDHYWCATPSRGTVIQTNLRAGQATVARIREPEPCGNFTYNGVLMGYIDQHGNESKVAIRGSSDGNTLHLVNPNSKLDDSPDDLVDE